MATGTLWSAPWFTALDEDGETVSGAKAYFYLAGTTTLTTTYSDVTLLVANANPVIADTAGRIGPVFLTPGSSVKLVLQDSTGASIRTQDNIAATPDAAADVTGVAGESLSAGAVVYLSDGSGSLTAGNWYLADSSFAYASRIPEIGMTLAAIASGSSGTIRLIGRVTGLTGLTVGTTYYTSPIVPGALASSVASDSNDLMRFIGVADTTTSIILARDSPAYTAWTVISATAVGTQANWAPTGLLGHTLILWSGASALTLTGLGPGNRGQRVAIVNQTAAQVILCQHQTASLSGYGFTNLVTSGDTPVGPGGRIEYMHNGAGWTLMTHDQGAPITPTFADSSYSGDGTDGNWALAAGDVTTQTYEVCGKRVKISFYLVTTTTVNTPTELRISNAAWGGFTIAKSKVGFAMFNANGAGNTAAFTYGVAATTYVAVAKFAGATFADFTDLNNVLGEIEVEVT